MALASIALDRLTVRTSYVVMRLVSTWIVHTEGVVVHSVYSIAACSQYKATH